jgi:hypothetical protein
MPRFCLAAITFFLCVMAFQIDAKPAETRILPRDTMAVNYFGNDAPWFTANVPFFECSDPQIEQIYYYRWKLYKAHLHDLGQRGYIVSEFLDDVGWTFNRYQSLNDATAFHINEGRWLKDNRYMDDYINFMYSGGNDRHFSEAIAAAAYARYLVNGDRAFAIKNLAAMKNIYQLWDDHYDFSKGMYFIEPLLDATEYSIASIDTTGGKDGFLGGDSFRPTINSYMFANAEAISRLSFLAGDTNVAGVYAAKAEHLRDAVETNLWNDDLQHFVDRFKVSNSRVHYWDFIRGRELAGYAPWYFELPDGNPKYEIAWKHALDSSELDGVYGLRTAEPGYEFYLRQYRYAVENGKRLPECQWNGPSWPFQTTLVLGGMANLLNDYTQDVVQVEDYVRLLKQYTRQHFLNGRPDLQEDYNPDSGKIIVGLSRSHHYNHSGYNDLIITGLAGLRPRADDVLEINPLVSTDPSSTNFIRYFCLENVSYHGSLITIVYDYDGTHYKKGAGLSVFVNGRQAIAPSPLGRKTVSLASPLVSPALHPVDLAVNLTRKGFPRPSASINNYSDQLFQAIDGRVWFFPEIKNYWPAAGSTNVEDWYELEFDNERSVHSVQLYFLSNGTSFAAPKKYAIQYWTGHDWREVSGSHKMPQKPLANGENTITFRPVKTARLRAVFANSPDGAVALVEFKIF